MNDFIRITRIHNSNFGTFGVLKINEIPFCVTLEPRDRENKVSESCIPLGQYECRRFDSPKYGKTWLVLDVPDRSHILFHAGNVAAHSKGCILLAQHFGKLSGDLAVLNSGKTFTEFLRQTRGANSLHLTINECF